MKKSICSLVLALAIILTNLPISTYASSNSNDIVDFNQEEIQNLKLILNGKAIKLNQKPVKVNNQILVSIEEISDLISAEIKADITTKELIINYGALLFSIGVNSYQAQLKNLGNNNISKIVLDVPLISIDDSLYIQLKPFLESLGFSVVVNDKSNTVNIYNTVAHQVKSLNIPGIPVAYGVKDFGRFSDKTKYKKLHDALEKAKLAKALDLSTENVVNTYINALSKNKAKNKMMYINFFNDMFTSEIIYSPLTEDLRQAFIQYESVKNEIDRLENINNIKIVAETGYTSIESVKSIKATVKSINTIKEYNELLKVLSNKTEFANRAGRVSSTKIREIVEQIKRVYDYGKDFIKDAAAKGNQLNNLLKQVKNGEYVYKNILINASKDFKPNLTEYFFGNPKFDVGIGIDAAFGIIGVVSDTSIYYENLKLAENGYYLYKDNINSAFKTAEKNGVKLPKELLEAWSDISNSYENYGKEISKKVVGKTLSTSVDVLVNTLSPVAALTFVSGLYGMGKNLSNGKDGIEAANSYEKMIYGIFINNYLVDARSNSLKNMLGIIYPSNGSYDKLSDTTINSVQKAVKSSFLISSRVTQQLHQYQANIEIFCGVKNSFEQQIIGLENSIKMLNSLDYADKNILYTLMTIGNEPSYQLSSYVTTVDDFKVSKQEYAVFSKINMNQFLTKNSIYSATYDWNTKINGKAAKDIIKEDTLDNIQEIKIQLIKAKEAGVKLDSTDLNSIDETINQRVKEAGSKQEAEKVMQEACGVSLSEYKVVYQDIYLADKYMIAEHNKITFTDDEVKKYYNDNKKEYDKVTITHILISTVDSNGVAVSKEKKAEAKKKAEELLAKVKDGADIKALAEKNSEDTGVTTNKGEYTFGRGKMVPEFENWAFADRKARDVDIVESTFGYHVIQFEKRTETPFKDVKDSIKSTLISEKFSAEFHKKMEDWKRQSEYTLIKNEKMLEDTDKYLYN